MEELPDSLFFLRSLLPFRAAVDIHLLMLRVPVAERDVWNVLDVLCLKGPAPGRDPARGTLPNWMEDARARTTERVHTVADCLSGVLASHTDFSELSSGRASVSPRRCEERQ